jgi:hypothetical protein
MFKVICKNENCENANQFYYLINEPKKIICGGCKEDLVYTKMSKTDFDKTFDYDPYEIHNDN